ncbi:NfeD family protein [Pontiellaceae bacterium B1224]|nr:NfeD family protein [Pontiellaceae bacterium B1224]
MKTATIICIAFEVLLLVAVVLSYRLNTLLGIIMTFLWSLSAGFIFKLGEELDEPPEPLHKKETREPKFERLIGSSGITVSILNPAGMIEIENQRIEATAFMGLIESGKHVEIVDAKSNTVIVKERR